jgi:hypothetical protein
MRGRSRSRRGRPGRLAPPVSADATREVGAYELAFERLRGLAMSPDDTVAFLRTAMQEGGA